MWQGRARFTRRNGEEDDSALPYGKVGKWVPNCCEGFRICRKVQDSKAEKFAEYEAKEDGDAPKKDKKE